MNVAVFYNEIAWKCQVKKNCNSSFCKKEWIHKADDMVAHKYSNKKVYYKNSSKQSTRYAEIHVARQFLKLATPRVTFWIKKRF